MMRVTAVRAVSMFAVLVGLEAGLVAAGCAAPKRRPRRRAGPTKTKPTAPEPAAPAPKDAAAAVKETAAGVKGAAASTEEAGPAPGPVVKPDNPGRAFTYYVDQKNPRASDENPGSRKAPFKTISKAVDVVKPGDSVLVRPGVYRESLLMKTSGTREKPILFEGEKRDDVVVSGADPLTGWRKEPGQRPVYSVPWKADFIINTNPDGSKVRNHGSAAPIGCAEQFVWDGRPLQQVMKLEAVKAGTYFVDWGGDRAYVWLPDGGDPNASEVLGCSRGTLVGRAGYWAHWKDARHIHLKKMTFRYASNFAQRGGIKVWHGWRVEDVVSEWNNAGGVNCEGDDIVLLRVISQDNGHSGIGGSQLKNILVKDCVSRRNNRKGFPVGWSGGGGKFLKSDGLRIVNHTAYGNAGPGIWLDWDNRNYVIENCACYANMGNEHGWEGMGIFTEANEGPGRIVRNVCYSNTGSGIEVAESQHVLVEGNTLVDNGAHIGLRAMEGRAQHKLENVVVKGNVFKDWRGAAVNTSLGNWDENSPSTKKITIDRNVYDYKDAGAKRLFRWAGKDLGTLDEVRARLGCEKQGKRSSVRFDRDLVRTVVRKQQRAKASIELALRGVPVGGTVNLPVNGRTSIARAGRGWRCQVFDLSNAYVTVEIRSEYLRRQVERIQPYPMTETVLVRGRLTAKSADRIEVSVSGVAE